MSQLINKLESKKTKNKKIGLKKISLRLLFFIVYELLLCAILSILLVFHGPFTALKETFVTTAWGTLSHRYLAQIFVSQKEIDEILNKNKVNTSVQDLNQIHFTKTGKTSNGTNGISIYEIKKKTFKGHLIEIDDPNRVSVGVTADLKVKGNTLEEIISNDTALGGINAGGFSNGTTSGTGSVPTGIIVKDGKVVFNEGYSPFRMIGLDTSGKLILMNECTLKDIKTKKIRDAITFGPILVVNGNPMITSGDGGWGVASRAAIGQKKDGTILLLTIDGERLTLTGPEGATLRDLQDVLLEYGAVNAANLDGGKSTTLMFDSKLINKPENTLGQRAIPSAFIFK